MIEGGWRAECRREEAGVNLLALGGTLLLGGSGGSSDGSGSLGGGLDLLCGLEKKICVSCDRMSEDNTVVRTLAAGLEEPPTRPNRAPMEPKKVRNTAKRARPVSGLALNAATGSILASS